MTTLATYATGLAAAAGLAVAWIAVQDAWRRTFPERRRVADALAGRMGCHGCARTEPCQQAEARGACHREETP